MANEIRIETYTFRVQEKRNEEEFLNLYSVDGNFFFDFMRLFRLT